MQNGYSPHHDSLTKLDEDDETEVSIQNHDNNSTNTYPIAQELSENEQVSYVKTGKPIEIFYETHM